MLWERDCRVYRETECSGQRDYMENFQSTRHRGIMVQGSQLDGMARLSFNRKVDFQNKLGQPSLISNQPLIFCLAEILFRSITLIHSEQ